MFTLLHEIHLNKYRTIFKIIIVVYEDIILYQSFFILKSFLKIFYDLLIFAYINNTNLGFYINIYIYSNLFNLV